MGGGETLRNKSARVGSAWCGEVPPDRPGLRQRGERREDEWGGRCVPKTDGKGKTEKGTSLIFNVRTSQSYSGTLPVNVTVSNPGGGYTNSDSVTAVYSMQVSGDSNSGTYTLNISIQATTGYNESENAAGAVSPWTIEEPGSYQLSFQSGGSYAVVGGVVKGGRG